mgnify:CR=1 FL=1
MNIENLQESIKEQQYRIVVYCESFEAPQNVDVGNILKWCSYLDNAITSIGSAESLSDIGKGLTHAQHLFYKINREVAKCKDSSTEPALSMYKISNAIQESISTFLIYKPTTNNH